ncbi:hypothetical protein ACFQBQ_17380 [Granulicella cerasi]|uniref:DUF2029 domain-containing protein n=1 Tax=Granulicella cerasi TaxID=741063 RepID=A0ABW1ZD31_9BACT|nr:hypothetical protein [Granulicella cerasi]
MLTESGTQATRIVPRTFWVCAVIAIVVWALVPNYVVGWDLNVYKAALISLRHHHDPYADAIAVQRAFHAEGPHPPGTPVPFCYVYSPITLPIVGLAARLPLVFDAIVYWTIYVAATIAAIWFGTKFFIDERERRVFRFVLPAIVFFPALLQNDVFFAGNIAYILYAALLLCTWYALRKGAWLPFYLVLVAVSCVKAPLMYLVVIPLMLAKKQWLPAAIAVAAGVALFLIQPHIWPDLYRNYMTGVELQFSFNHDFSSSPSGLTADALFDVLPYKPVWGGFWLFCSCLFGGILLWLRKQYFAGRISLQQWVPVMLLGVALLNPRIMEYDLAPITVFFALILWRFSGSITNSFGAQIGVALGAFGLANGLAAHTWRPTACMTLVLLFFFGSYDLFRRVKRGEPALGSTLYPARA